MKLPQDATDEAILREISAELAPRDDLRAAIMELSLALDRQRQGECWPDPIAWDGRALEEQASDLLVLAERAEEIDPEMRSRADDRIAEAAEAVREALDAS